MVIHKPDSSSFLRTVVYRYAKTTAERTRKLLQNCSSCVLVIECGADADGVVDGDSWGDLTSEFKTDLVIRGAKTSKIELTLDFDEPMRHRRVTFEKSVLLLL